MPTCARCSRRFGRRACAFAPTTATCWPRPDVEGVAAFGRETMTIRTSTRVKPGRHEAVAAALRLLIKETFDRQARGVSRKGLIPRLDEDREPWPQGEKRS